MAISEEQAQRNLQRYLSQKEATNVVPIVVSSGTKDDKQPSGHIKNHKVEYVRNKRPKGKPDIRGTVGKVQSRPVAVRPAGVSRLEIVCTRYGAASIAAQMTAKTGNHL